MNEIVYSLNSATERWKSTILAQFCNPEISELKLHQSRNLGSHNINHYLGAPCLGVRPHPVVLEQSEAALD